MFWRFSVFRFLNPSSAEGSMLIIGLSLSNKDVCNVSRNAIGRWGILVKPFTCRYKEMRLWRWASCSKSELSFICAFPRLNLFSGEPTGHWMGGMNSLLCPCRLTVWMWQTLLMIVTLSGYFRFRSSPNVCFIGICSAFRKIWPVRESYIVQRQCF